MFWIDLEGNGRMGYCVSHWIDTTSRSDVILKFIYATFPTPHNMLLIIQENKYHLWS